MVLYNHQDHVLGLIFDGIDAVNKLADDSLIKLEKGVLRQYLRVGLQLRTLTDDLNIGMRIN